VILLKPLEVFMVQLSSLLLLHLFSNRRADEN
jgi:hypothetical protein